MPAPELKQFDDRTQLVEQLTAAIVSQLGSAIAQRGQALLAVSGGNTPIPLFECLSHQTIEWEKVTITLVDERWVNDTHSDSNAKLAKDYLLKNNASVSKFIPLYNGMASPFGAKSEVNQALTELHLPFDAVILGMGDDGHTASFFPHASTLEEALNLDDSALCCAIEPVTAPHKRMTLTLSALLNSKSIFLLVTGAGKFPILKRTMEIFCDKGNTSVQQWLRELPLRSVLHQYLHPVSIYFAE